MEIVIILILIVYNILIRNLFLYASTCTSTETNSCGSHKPQLEHC